MQPSRSQILRLYKDLLKYGNGLALSDKNYYKNRIRIEFSNNKERKSTVDKQENTIRMFHCIFKRNRFLETVVPLVNPLRVRTIDRSKVPVLDEKDLEENFIRGGGPGGQKVNKGNNCVFLIHKPTGLNVKVHESRYQEQNRKIARQRLTVLLDNMLNKENSVENQKKNILNEKSLKKIHKQKKLMELKNKWKQLISEYS